ncbi:hypothetical protein [Aeromonas sp. 603757]|uniref:hypothetical protein n=1 Tax=Aeromonas sp. 603757 TaxID=2712050 RepID=UPI003BA01AF3
MAEESEQTQAKKASCFVIMPISDQMGYEQGHFSLVYEDIIKPAIELAGMETIRADETINTNLIQLDILRKVIDSDIAICDMSAKNPNVFYELGVRQAFDKPTVLMIDEATTAPFDVSSLRYVTYSKEMKYRDVKSAVMKLADTLRDTYSKREDKTEINSLIRLMELTSPAQLSSSDLSEEDKSSILHEIQYSELMNVIQNLKSDQLKLLDEVQSIKRLNLRNNMIVLDEWSNANNKNNIKTMIEDIDEYNNRWIKKAKK